MELSKNSMIYAVWQERQFENNGFDIFFAKSTDNGGTFSQPDNISENAGRSTNPQIENWNENVYVVWEDNTPGNYNIFFTVSQDNGGTFSQPINISQTSENSRNPQISVSNGNVYVTWREYIIDNYEILFSVSTNNGQNFSQPINISQSVGYSLPSRMIAVGENVYVVWEDNTPGNYNIFFSVSTNNGQNFSQPINISQSNANSEDPQISISGNNIYVTWREYIIDNYEILFSVSTNNGQNFSQPINISQSNGNSGYPEISVAGNNVYVTWHDNYLGNRHIFFTKSTNNGQDFTQPIYINQNTLSSIFPSITAINQYVYIVWRDITIGNTRYDIFFASSTDEGLSFSTPINISNNTGQSENQKMAISGDNVYIIWTDNTPGNNDIFFAVSVNNGQTFSQPENISNSERESYESQISVPI